MRCPFCAHAESRVTDSRVSASGDVIRRRRECESCEKRFTSYERVEETLPLVVKKDGRREPFDRQKIMGGLRRACEKRVVPLSTLDTVVEAIERSLLDGQAKEVSSSQIGEYVMTRLREIDEIAYVRFASVYRSFRDIAELRAEIERLSGALPAPGAEP